MLDPGVDFLNHGSFGAVPRVVFDEQTEWRRRIEAAPVEVIARRRLELIDHAKRPVGEWLGMRDADFGLVTNATEGVNAVLHSLRFRPGDELLTTSHVYNAVRQAMRFTAARWGAAYREVDVALPARSAGEIAEAVLAGVSDRTRLLVIDHVTSPTALVFPVEQIVAGCNERGVDVLVDGAHAPGMLPLDVGRIGAAYYAGNLHKWGFAPRGSGFLWVRPDRQADVHPAVVSHHYAEGFCREFSWQGTRDLSACFALPRAVEFTRSLGAERVRAHNRALAVWAHQMLCDRLGVVEPISPLDGSLLGSMASVPLPEPFARLEESQVEALQQRLYSEHRVEVPLMRFGSRLLLRVSCQVYNSAAPYERLAGVVEALRRGASLPM
jgi:isopenicillin-N epimerase